MDNFLQHKINIDLLSPSFTQTTAANLPRAHLSAAPFCLVENPLKNDEKALLSPLHQPLCLESRPMRWSSPPLYQNLLEVTNGLPVAKPKSSSVLISLSPRVAMDRVYHSSSLKNHPPCFLDNLLLPSVLLNLHLLSAGFCPLSFLCGSSGLRPWISFFPTVTL